MAHELIPVADRPTATINLADTERWLSIAGGALLALGAIKVRGVAGIAMTAVAGGLIYRGVSGHCEVYEAIGVDRSGDEPSPRGIGGLVERKPLHLEAGVTIGKPADELYEHWRDLENLAEIMSGVRSIEAHGDGTRSHWKMLVAPGVGLEFDATITEDKENRRISWRTDDDATVHHHGTVTFKPLGRDRGTEIHVTLGYDVPGGAIGRGVAHLLDTFSEKHLEADLRRFKRRMETGSAEADGADEKRAGEGEK